MNRNLAGTVLAATGINCDSLSKEFNQLLDHNGLTSDDLTIEQLREVMADYLNQVFLELAEPEDRSA